MSEKLKIKFPIIVEGKYDKIKIESLVDGCVITTGGFSIFNNSEKLALIKKLADLGGIILLTDSDGAGRVIRGHISSAVPKDKIFDIYTPQKSGKEKRKKIYSKEGTLGVEGTDADTLRALLAPFASEDFTPRKEITKVDFYEDGFSGGDESRARREKLAKYFSLPASMSANALLDALNILYGKDEYEKAKSVVFR